MSEWISVDDRLPDRDVPVLVISKIYPDQICAAMLTDGGDGWMWAINVGYSSALNDPDSYEVDDDYEFTRWMPLPAPHKEQ